MKERIGVMVIDDRAIVREGVRGIMARQPDLELVAESAYIDDAVWLYQSCRADVVLMDLHLRSGSGLDGMRALLRHDRNARIVVLTDHGDEEHVFRAISSGARGYVLKSDDALQILCALRAVHAGRRYLTPEASELLAAYVPGSALTSREKQVIDLLARGEKNRVIARHLGLRDETVKGHIKNILSKLGARSRTEAVSKAIRRGVVRLD